MTNAIAKPLKILIVDDDKTFNRALEFRLTNAGFITETVFEGASALKVIQEKSYDLVVLDLVMPGMSGFEVLAEMRKINTQIPIIVLSLLHQEEDMKRVHDLGATKYFAKSSASFMGDLIKYVEGMSVGAPPAAPQSSI